MAFLETVIFPDDISYGSTSSPGFNTTVVRLASGQEVRISNWASPRRRYNVAYGIKTSTQLADAINLFMAVAGAANGFRFKDFTDFTTGVNHIEAPTNVDFVVGVGTGVSANYQLFKQYTSGGVTVNRNITKPITGTIVVAFNGVNQPSGWSVDYSTGILTANAPLGENVSWGGQFHVPVRFDDQTEKDLSARIDDFSNRSIDSMVLVEIKDDTVFTDSFYYGGAAEYTLSTNTAISYGVARVLSYDPTTGGLWVQLPTPTDIPAGGPHFYITNMSGSNSFAVKNQSGTTLVTLSAGQTVEAWLSVDGGGSKIWYLK